nr:MAG TPA: hypothetical protein [Caudoviricetes sp.]
MASCAWDHATISEVVGVELQMYLILDPLVA